MPSAFFSMLTPEKSWKSPATVMSSPAALMSSIAFSISFWSGPESYRHIIHTHHLIYQNVGEEFAPKEYKSILTAEQRVKGAKITLLDLESAMNDLFRTPNSLQYQTLMKRKMPWSLLFKESVTIVKGLDTKPREW
jgi:hypothetical protein